MGNNLLDLSIKPIIGMVHLLPLPGSPKYKGSLDEVYERALFDANALLQGGIDGIIVENAGDTPSLIGENVDQASITTMAVITQKIALTTGLPIGVNCMSNSVKADFAICVASGASFIRSTAWANGYIAPSGYVAPVAPQGLRYRNSINADNVKILADVQVKNGSHFLLSDKTLLDQCSDLKSSLADSIIVTGKTTGVAPDLNQVSEIKQKCGLPVILGSGADNENICDFLNYCDGVIIGTNFKKNRSMAEPVIEEKVSQFMAIVNRWRREGK